MVSHFSIRTGTPGGAILSVLEAAVRKWVGKRSAPWCALETYAITITTETQVIDL